MEAKKPLMTREQQRDRYRHIAQATLELERRDTQLDSNAGAEIQAEAREFLFSEDAELWADMASFDLRRLRLSLSHQTSQRTRRSA